MAFKRQRVAEDLGPGTMPGGFRPAAGPGAEPTEAEIVEMQFPAVKLRGLPFSTNQVEIKHFLVRRSLLLHTSRQ